MLNLEFLKGMYEKLKGRMDDLHSKQELAREPGINPLIPYYKD